MPRIAANGIELEYDMTGPEDGEPLVLVMGFSGQMTRWSSSFRAGLASAGYRVVWFDNRDIGLSHEFVEQGLPDTPAIMQKVVTGEDATRLAPYLLDDMADDLIALIDGLGLKPAHVLGASMGGMIVQLAALKSPDHIRSVIPVMTTSGDPSLPQSTPEAMEALTKQPPAIDRESVARHGAWVQSVIGSNDEIRDPEDYTMDRIRNDYDRSYRPLGVARQYASIVAQPRWHDRLHELKKPVFVMHGAEDPLIPPACGKDIVDRVPMGISCSLKSGGHDLPESMVPQLVEEITNFLRGVAGRQAAS